VGMAGRPAYRSFSELLGLLAWPLGGRHCCPLPTRLPGSWLGLGVGVVEGASFAGCGDTRTSITCPYEGHG
jgi:hypothetical protein